MDGGIPSEEWREGWVNGIPRRRCQYITWEQIRQYHPDFETEELAEYLGRVAGISIEGEQTACYRAFEYLVWLKAKDDDHVGS